MIVNRQRRVPLGIQSLQDFYEHALRALHFRPDSVTVQFISDGAMARLNQRYRKKRGPTDVLSFPARGGRPSQTAEYVGDIAISPETARRNARRDSRSLGFEIRILILHGMIHLAGFDHETDNGEMDRLERRLRRRLDVGDARKESNRPPVGGRSPAAARSEIAKRSADVNRSRGAKR